MNDAAPLIVHPKDVDAETADALGVAYSTPPAKADPKGRPTQGRPAFVPTQRQIARANRGRGEVLASYSRDLRFRLVAAALGARQIAMRADPVRLSKAQAKRAEADARHMRRLERRNGSMGDVAVRPAGYGAKHHRYEQEIAAQVEAQQARTRIAAGSSSPA